MDNEQYLRLLSGTQHDFNQLWRELIRYAARKAVELCIYHALDAANESVNEIEDLIINNKAPVSWWLARTIIDRNLIDFKRKSKVESVADYDLSGMKRDGIPGHGRTVRDEKASLDESIVDFKVYKVADKHGYPKDKILELQKGKERDICILYWQHGFEQNEIASTLKVTKQYVSKVIKEHRKF